MKPEQWQRLKAHLAHLLTLDAAARLAYLEALDDHALRLELEELLAAPSLAGLRLTDTSDAGAPVWPNPADADVSIAPDTLVGPYRILSILGVGGMGEVFKAQDERLGRVVALKRLPTPWSTDARRIRRFEREAKAASALNHPNIVTVHDIVTSEQGRFIVTELVDGDTLQDRIRRGPIEVGLAVDIAIQVARGLEVAHAAGIVHRDIKPANIMVRRDGVVKLLDFGVAKLTESDDQEPAGTAAGARTVAGVAIGTLRYMSPEQARGLHVDQRSDIFSLGVVLFEMLTGSSPFPGTTPSDMLVAILQAEPAPIRAQLPTLPPRLERVIARALRKPVDQRYRRAQDFRAELQEIQRQLPLAASEGAKPTEVGTSGREAGHIGAPAPAEDGGTATARALFSRPTLTAGIGLAGLAGLVALIAYRTFAPAHVAPPIPESSKQASASPTSSVATAHRDAGLAGVRWVAIPGTSPTGTPWRAEFEMGCVPRDTACDADERPQRRVTLTRPYALTDTEVTVGQYAEYASRTGRPMPRPPSFPQDPAHPVVGVSWDDGLAFCTWLGGRLPTEAEWEHAARGGLVGQTYGWGTGNAARGGNFAGTDDGFAFTAPVASFGPNRNRLYDMSGNVWEWVSDWYQPSYSGLPSVDPTGPASGDRRVLRGDAWSNRRKNGRLSDRGRNAPDIHLAVYGIRCARDDVRSGAPGRR